MNTHGFSATEKSVSSSGSKLCISYVPTHGRMGEGSSFQPASPLEVSWLQRRMHANAGSRYRRQYSDIQRDQGSAAEATRLSRSRSAGSGGGRFSRTAASGEFY